MDDAWRSVMAALAGEHAYDHRARAGNWFGMWVFVVLAFVVAGVSESYIRGWKTIQPTPVLLVGCVLGALSGALWIRSFNLTRYRIGDGDVECFTVWPRRGWKLWLEEVQTARLEPSHGHWSLVLDLRTGGRRRIVLTQSMRKALDLP